MIRRSLPRLAALGWLALLSCAPPSEPPPRGAPNYPATPRSSSPPASPAPPVAGLRIERLTANQAVQGTLMRDFEVPDLEVPLVAGKDTLLRAFLAPDPDWEPREVIGVIAVEAGDRSFVFRRRLDVLGPSEDGALDSTVYGVVPGAFVQPGLRVSVGLVEADGAVRPGATDGARWPSEGSQELALSPFGGGIVVRVLPVVYRADGSDRRPDVSEAQIELLRDHLLRVFPTAQIDLIVEDELPWDGPLGPLSGMNDLLDAVVDEREARGVPEQDYLYALVAPAPSRLAFCVQGCVAGLSYRPENPHRAWMRASVGLGYPGIRSAETMAHELGHAQGRRHAPCGDPGAVDPHFPEPGATLGAWGWDGEELLPPEATFDLMSYCAPAWISRYQYTAIFERIAAMHGLLDRGWDRVPVRWIAEGPGGELRDRGVRWRSLDVGEPVAVTMEGDGVPVDGVARFVALDDQPGGAWLLPDPGATGFARLEP